MGILLHRITDVKRLLSLDETGLRALAESDAADDIVALVINKLQLDVLLMMSHHLAGAEIIDTFRAEEWARIVGAKGCKLAKIVVETNVKILELQFSIDVQFRLYLRGQDVRLHILLKTALELRHVLHLHR